MTLNESLAADVQRFSPGNIVELYTLDCSFINGPVYRFTPNVFDGAPVVFNGQTYTPIEMESEGWEWSGKGASPQPIIRLSNVNRVTAAAVYEFSDLLGATITRTRTLSDYLDDGATPDPEAIFRQDIYRISRKSAQNKMYIEFELRSAIDQMGKKLPGEQVYRDACRFTYRRWDADAGSFVYTKATCPYTGSSYFDALGNVVVNPALDRCSKTLDNGCRKRFGQNGELPFGGYPGVARL